MVHTSKTGFPPTITLTTDFGLQGEYVGAMKGVMLNINPHCRVIDITHQISPQNILQAAFVLEKTNKYYPSGTIHLVVVDPGVGTERRALIIKKREHFFVGPDNGVFSFILDEKGKTEAVEIKEKQYFLSPLSSTFHGRDLFAPVAAHLSLGTDLKKFGLPAKDFVRMEWPRAELKENRLAGKILWADSFGNLITNITREEYGSLLEGNPILIKGAGWKIQHLARTYAEARPREPIALFGSSDLLEIAMNQGNAYQRLGIKPGEIIHIEVQE
jgi:S-adenosyl-L-methionine hydrolase (adenosine-forming)